MTEHRKARAFSNGRMVWLEGDYSLDEASELHAEFNVWVVIMSGEGFLGVYGNPTVHGTAIVNAFEIQRLIRSARETGEWTFESDGLSCYRGEPSTPMDTSSRVNVDELARVIEKLLDRSN